MGEFYPEPEMAVFISGLEPLSDAERNELWRQLGEDVLLYQNAQRDTDSVLSGISGDRPLQHAQFGVDDSQRSFSRTSVHLSNQHESRSRQSSLSQLSSSRAEPRR